MWGRGVTWKAWVDARDDELSRRIGESTEDRQRLRQAVGERVPRAEYELLVQRVGRLETLGARLLGGLSVVVILLALLGVVLRYTVG